MTQTLTKVSILDVIGTPIAVSTEKAQLVFEKLDERLSKNQEAPLSFAGVTNLVTAFLNTAVGQLYSKFSDEHIRRYFKAVDATPEQLATVERVLDIAKQFFDNPEPFEEAYQLLAEHPSH